MNENFIGKRIRRFWTLLIYFLLIFPHFHKPRYNKRLFSSHPPPRILRSKRAWSMNSLDPTRVPVFFVKREAGFYHNPIGAKACPKTIPKNRREKPMYLLRSNSAVTNASPPSIWQEKNRPFK